MAKNAAGVPLVYYEAPDSLLDMDDQVHTGLIAIGCLASLSVLLTSSLLAFITWRMIVWRSHYTSFIGRNQSIVLIYQLILADFLQSLGFVVSFHWASNREIIGPDGVCFAQGWLIQLGDVASGFFVLSIAVHTTFQLVFSHRLTYKTFIACILGVWTLAMLLTSLAPIIGGRYIFLNAGIWCWISSEHDNLRLLLHYLWIFIVQFGSILVYVIGFYYIYRTKKSVALMLKIRTTQDSLQRAATAMLAYALAYTLLTLPLAVGRMAAMSGNTLPDSYYIFAGALFTSSGWVDTCLYALTRRTLLFEELHVNEQKPKDRLTRGTRPFVRQASTESILAEAGFRGTGGIVMNRVVKVELEEFDINDGSAMKTPGTFTSALAVRK
ncbi:G protein-coupled glucose receptor regulating Gpa2-domain-containing protein [Xylariales sp. PMI_506]|nr:G protein-coupled glucose receptor regulating Gpa2-domain-containing protein [Xylariales sp. PMI_506]